MLPKLRALFALEIARSALTFTNLPDSPGEQCCVVIVLVTVALRSVVCAASESILVAFCDRCEDGCKVQITGWGVTALFWGNAYEVEEFLARKVVGRAAGSNSHHTPTFYCSDEILYSIEPHVTPTIPCTP